MISLCLRLIIVFTLDTNHIANDSFDYHAIAVNVINGHGFSFDETSPYTKEYFREPGYPFFLAIVYLPFKLTSSAPTYLPTWSKNELYENIPKEIVFAKIIQAILNALSVVLFFLTIKLFIQYKLAAIISCSLALFAPFGYYSTLILRETFLTFLLLLLNYLFLLILIKSQSKEVKSKNVFLYALLGLILAISILTFQVYIYLIPIIIFSFAFYTRKILNSALFAFVLISSCILVLTPWVYRSYQCAKNWKVIKTAGCSLTYEMNLYSYANQVAFELSNNQDSSYLLNNKRAWAESGENQFSKSFDGTYRHFSDSLLNSLYTSKQIKSGDKILYSFSFLGKCFRRSFFIYPLPHTNKPLSELIFKEGNIVLILPVLFGIAVGLFAFYGIFFYGLSVWYVMPVFIFHLLFFPVLGDETRRMLPIFSFLLFFAIIGIIDLYLRITNPEKLNLFKSGLIVFEKSR